MLCLQSLQRGDSVGKVECDETSRQAHDWVEDIATANFWSMYRTAQWTRNLELHLTEGCDLSETRMPLMLPATCRYTDG